MTTQTADDNGFDSFLDIIQSPTEVSQDEVSTGEISPEHGSVSDTDQPFLVTTSDSVEQISSENGSISDTEQSFIVTTPDEQQKKYENIGLESCHANEEGLQEKGGNSSFVEQQHAAPRGRRTDCEAIGDKVEESISGFFYKLGSVCSIRPKTTIVSALAIAIGCALGMASLNTENRPEKLWLPQNTQAEVEQNRLLSYFPRASRFQNVIASTMESNGNVLTKDHLLNVMKLHDSIETRVSVYEEEKYTLTDLCTFAGGTCATSDINNDICNCMVLSVLKVWNYDFAKLEADNDVMATLNTYGKREDLEGVLGNPVFDSLDQLVSAESMAISYFLKDRSEVVNGNTVDPVNEAWEEHVFLKTVQVDFEKLDLAYLSSRSFADEFGGEITGDLIYVQVSYIAALLFLGATLGTKIFGRGSRWAMANATLVLIALATVAGFGIASLAGLLYSPMHSVLPFVLLGIGVDDAFVIANAFDREREGIPRESEDDEALVKRSAKALSRAGASITVTSLTDLVAFAISSTSALPALASFCAYASINIFFLWALAATFFTSAMVIDEKRQRANKRDLLCCITRKKIPGEEDTGSKEGHMSMYFRRFHAPKILSKAGKVTTLICFAGILGLGLYGVINLPVEDSARNFIPRDSYINAYMATSDTYFPSSGESLYITFESGTNIYNNRDSLAALDTRLIGLSDKPPYIADPNSESTYQNVMASFKEYLDTNGSAALGGADLGEDGWPANYAEFVDMLRRYSSYTGPGSKFSMSVSYGDSADLQAYHVKLEYVRLAKEFRGETIDDASRQIEAMDATREMVESWDNLHPAFPFSDKFIAIEGFKIIGYELYRNVGLAILCVGAIVLLTVANIRTAILITLNVGLCIVEILGFMYVFGIVIDSISVTNVVLAVGLSVDYSAHIGHCFMMKGGASKDIRATETLADMGASVLNGALSTFLAVAVLLFSTSYVFKTLAIQFALTVGLGVVHGLVLLPVVLSLCGPEPFASAERPHNVKFITIMAKENALNESSDSGTASKDSSLEEATTTIPDESCNSLTAATDALMI